MIVRTGGIISETEDFDEGREVVSAVDRVSTRRRGGFPQTLRGFQRVN
jgi:hypothetical protein